MRSAARCRPAGTEARRPELVLSSPDHAGGSAGDPVHAYLKEIGKVPLLDASNEVSLAT